VSDDVPTLTVERTRTWNVRYRRLIVLIDGRRAGKLKSGETRAFPVNDGKHSVIAKVGWLKSPVVRVTLGDGATVHLVADLPPANPFRLKFSVVRALLKPVLSLTPAPPD
jgi:hypothetical protein